LASPGMSTMFMTDTRLDGRAAFTRRGRTRLGEKDVDAVLNLVVELAKHTIPGASEVSVTLIRDKGPYTAAYTSCLALDLDEAQYDLGHGPCLDASTGIATAPVQGADGATRWPTWVSRCRQLGVHSSLSVGLPVQDTVTGALSIYSTKPAAFDDDAIRLARTFAGYTAVVLANAHVYEVTDGLAQQMEAATEARAVIDQAKGIIMAERHCTADVASTILTELSRDSRGTVRDVAAALVHRAVEPSEQ